MSNLALFDVASFYQISIKPPTVYDSENGSKTCTSTGMEACHTSVQRPTDVITGRWYEPIQILGTYNQDICVLIKSLVRSKNKSKFY